MLCGSVALHKIVTSISKKRSNIEVTSQYVSLAAKAWTQIGLLDRL